MNHNIIINFCPILALKGYYIAKCFEAKVDKNSHHSSIPNITILRTLTTTKNGFTDKYPASWNLYYFDDRYTYVVIVRIISNDTHHLIFRIKESKTPDISLGMIKEKIDNITDNYFFYPTPFIYEGDDRYPSIVKYYNYNVLHSSGWIDTMNFTPDNHEALKLVKSTQPHLKISVIYIKEDKIGSFIFDNREILPLQDKLVYISSNLIVGEEYIYKSFTDAKPKTKSSTQPKVEIPSVSKQEDNEDELNEDEEED